MWLGIWNHSIRDPVSVPNELPGDYQFAIALAVEMDYDAIGCSPSSPSSAATGLGYSKMAFTAGLLAHHIRGLGYKAIACGNDTACSIPIAIDAGLGELARNGLLITPEFGSRVRLVNCIRTCPFNKPDGRLHDFVRWGIGKTPWLNKLFLWGDDLFGYGKKGNAEKFWTK